MSKQETIDAIVKLNPSATPDFLVSFGDDELTRYLGRLNDRQKSTRDEMSWRRNAILSASRKSMSIAGA